MERELANVLQINKLTPIEDKDRIELATVENWEVIVQKGDFKVGDLCLYCEYDTVLEPRPEYEFLRTRCYSKKYDGFRIRNMSMGGVFSQGIAFPLNLIPAEISIKEGMNVASILGVKKYDPNEEPTAQLPPSKNKIDKYLRKYKWYRSIRRLGIGKKTAGYPKTVDKSSETNIQKKYNVLRKTPHTYYVTEKLEGQAFCASLETKGIFKKRRYNIYSHSCKRKVGDNSNWDKVSTQFDIHNKLKGWDADYAIQGEIIGEGIQKNIYGIKGLDFYVYKVTDVKTGVALNCIALNTFCEVVGLKTVPVIKEYTELYDTLEEVLEESNAKSLINPKVLREGLVWRSVDDQSIGFKVRSPQYLAWFAKKDKTV